MPIEKPTKKLCVEIWSESEEDLKVVEAFIKKSMERFKKRDITLVESEIYDVAPSRPDLDVDFRVDPLDRLFRGSGGL